MSTFPITHHRWYPGGDSVAEIFEQIVDGDSSAYTVFNALETAIARYSDIAGEMRSACTAIVCDGDATQGPLHMASAMAAQFDKQADDVRRLLALLRGDNEPVRA